jgi:DNA-binding transcriptional MerR regulator
MTGLDQHVLRYWEGEFEALRPKKNRGGRRVYTREDIEMVLRIQRLLRDDKYTIEGARQVLAREAAEREHGRGPDHRMLELRDFLSDLLKQV